MKEPCAVRCCCHPNRILGYLDLPSTILWSHYNVISIRAQEATWQFDANPRITQAAVETHAVELRPFWYGDGRFDIAVCSEDRPIEFWRTIRGFHEYYGPYKEES